MPPEQLPLAVPELFPVLPLRHEEVRVIAGDGAEGQQPGLLQAVPGDVDPGSDGRLKAHVRGKPADGSPEDEPGPSDGQRITGPGIQLDQDGRIGHRPWPVMDLRPGSGRLGCHVTVEREARIHGADLEEPHALAPGIEHHGGQCRRPSDLSPLPHHGVQNRLELLGKGPARRDAHVGSQEHTGLIIEGALHVGSERVDRHERRHPQGDGAHEDGEATVAGSALSPGQTNRERPDHPDEPLASDTIRPSASETVRWARDARSRSWVTRISVVWDSWFNSSRSSTT